MKNDKIKKGLEETNSAFSTGNKNLDPFSLSKKTETLEDYVKENIIEVKELCEREEKLRTEYVLVQAQKKRMLERHIKILRSKTGIDHLQGKVKALSKLANDKLLEE
jgi:hypothetical protein